MARGMRWGPAMSWRPWTPAPERPIVSWFEWGRNPQFFFWKEEEANSRLRDILMGLFRRTLRLAQQEKVDLRTAEARGSRDQGPRLVPIESSRVPGPGRDRAPSGLAFTGEDHYDTHRGSKCACLCSDLALGTVACLWPLGPATRDGAGHVSAADCQPAIRSRCHQGRGNHADELLFRNRFGRPSGGIPPRARDQSIPALPEPPEHPRGSAGL